MVRPQAVALALLTVAIPLAGQAPPVAHHQQPGEAQPEYQEIASPMVIEVSMGATPRRKSVQDVRAWVATETGSFACQQARVRVIEIRKEEKRGKVTLRVLPNLVTKERRQDVDVTVAIVSESKAIRTKSWTDLTIGDDNSTANKMGFNIVGAAMASRSKSPEVDFEFTSDEFAALFGSGRAPLVRSIDHQRVKQPGRCAHWRACLPSGGSQ
jgi:hypothetical protein